MNDDELSAWVCDLIARRTPESDDLDYKATLAVETRPEKHLRGSIPSRC